MSFVKLFCLFILLAVTQGSSQPTWQRLHTPTSNNLKSLCFLDSLNGWVAGNKGMIIKTTNGGISWASQQVDTTSNIAQILFFNSQFGWAVAPVLVMDSTLSYGARIYRTTNGGDQWSYKFLPDELIYSVTFTDSLRGYIGSAFGRFFRTTDGGLTWIEAPVNPAPLFPINRIKFISPERGYAVGGRFDLAAVIWHTTNGGVSWFSAAVGGEPLYDIGFIDSSRFITVGGDPEYGVTNATTTDAGANWTYDTLGFFGIASAISFRTAKEAWCPLGFAGSCIYTRDEGNRWDLFLLQEQIGIFDLRFTDELHGYMVGDSGAVFKYYDSVTGIDDVVPADPKVSHLELFQNYPNPFNPSTTIRYLLPKAEYVNLKVYNVLGRSVEILVHEYQDAGYHSVTLRAEEFSSGVYFYRLEAGHFVETKKLLILR